MSKKELWGELRSLLAKLDNTFQDWPIDQLVNLRDFDLFHCIEETLKEKLAKKVISWDEYASEFAPYLLDSLKAIYNHLWVKETWIMMRQEPSLLLSNAAFLRHQSDFDTLQLIAFEEQLEVLAGDHDIILTGCALSFPKLKELRLLGGNTIPLLDAPLLDRVSFEPSRGDSQQLVSSVKVPHFTLRNATQLKAFEEISPCIETLVLSNCTLQSTMNNLSSETLKELYLMNTPLVCLHHEKSLREVLPALEVFYIKYPTYALFGERDLNDWFARDLPVNLHTVFSSDENFLAWLGHKHPEIKGISIASVNYVPQEGRYLSRLARQHGLKLRVLS